MTVVFEPGPESIGIARGTTAMSSRLIASSISSGVCSIRETLAWSIPLATEKRMIPPAIWKAPIVIEKSSKISVPNTAKTRRTVKATTIALRMIARFASGVALEVRVMKTEVTIIGLMITMSDGNATIAKVTASCIELSLVYVFLASL